MALIKKYEIRAVEASESRLLDQLQREHAFEGDIELQYLRLPDPWHSLQMERGEAELYMTLDMERNAPMGYGSVIYRRLLVDGERVLCGYLGNLKVMKNYHRKYIPLHRSYAECFSQRPETAVPYYYSTILETNKRAIRTLTSNRSFMPEYTETGRYVTTLLAGGKNKKRKSTYTLEEIPLQKIRPWLVLYHGEAAQFSFSPFLTEKDVKKLITYGNGRIYGLKEGDLPVAFGILLDPKMYKQTVVHAYRGKYRYLDVVNAVSRFRGRPVFPGKNKAFPLKYLSFVAIRNTDPGVFGEFVQQVRSRLRSRDILVLGYSDQHPYDDWLSGVRSYRYHSRMYLVQPREFADDPLPVSPGEIIHFECVEL